MGELSRRFIHNFLCVADVFTKIQHLFTFQLHVNHLGNFFFLTIGHCLEVSEGDLFVKSCTTFENGCPKEDFKNTDFYKCKCF